MLCLSLRIHTDITITLQAGHNTALYLIGFTTKQGIVIHV